MAPLSVDLEWLVILGKKKVPVDNGLRVRDSYFLVTVTNNAY